MKFNYIKRAIIVACGSVVAAIGLEAFLLPNQLLDGGVVGLSIIGAEILSIPLGILLFVLNLPFIYLGYRRLGKTFAIASISGVIMLSIATIILHDIPTVTDDAILAAVFGGVFVGFGVGLVIRSGATLDGAEIVAVLIDKRSPFSVGEIVMFMNIFIIGGAGFIFGWENAMYSLVAYFVAYKVIDITVEGLDESRSVWIVSNEYLKIGEAINNELGRKVTYVNGKDVSGVVSDGVILSVITRIEEQRLKSIIREYDPSAFVVINNTHDVMGKNFIARPKNSKARTIATL